LLYNSSATYTYKWMAQSLVGWYIDCGSSLERAPDQIFVFDYLFKAKLPHPKHPGKLSLFLTVHNLTDADYKVSVSFPQPDRWAEGGLKFEL